MDLRSVVGFFVIWVVSVVASPFIATFIAAPPDLLVVAVTLFAWERGTAPGQVVGFTLGASIDLLGMGFVGPTTAAYATAAHATSGIRRRLGPSVPALILALAVAAAASEIMATLLAMLAKLPVVFAPMEASTKLMLTLAAAPAVYLFRRPLGLAGHPVYRG